MNACYCILYVEYACVYEICVLKQWYFCWTNTWQDVWLSFADVNLHGSFVVRAAWNDGEFVQGVHVCDTFMCLVCMNTEYLYSV